MSEAGYRYRVRGTAVIADRERRVVMVRQVPGTDFWMLPGGGAEPGELFRQAATREILEETGLVVECGRLLWVTEQILRLSDHATHHVEVVYLARVTGVTASPPEHEWGYFSRTAPPPGDLGLPPGFWDALERDFRDYDPSIES